MNLILNQAILKRSIYSKFKSLGDFCHAIGIHRNSLSNYLSGKKLLPEVVEKALSSLELNNKDIFIVVTDKKNDILQKISPIVQPIILKYPDLSVVLFGSRARGTERRYSDIDLGVIGKNSLSLEQWSDIRNIVDEHSEELPFTVDVVDLQRADNEFLNSVKKDVKFIGGNPVNYFSLLH